jgi:hypothetical protein
VGSNACVECHVEIAESFARHPMGRSLFPMSEALASQPPLDKARFEAFGRRVWASREGDKVFHHVAMYDGKEKLYEQRFEARYVVGSGTHGYSYLEERDGFVYQTPISYFTINGLWAISPGFREQTLHGRPVIAPCLSCHANGLKMVPGVANKFEPGVFDGHAIGCERCHGPGEPHVRERERGDAVEHPYDTSTVNPARLPHRERDAVCQQCHLQGRVRILRAGRSLLEYRPGLRFEDFYNVFVDEAAAQQGKTIGHFEEMRRSKCYQATEGDAKLGCVSCHDPHYRPVGEARVEFFRGRCLRCHEGAGKPTCKEDVVRRRREAPGDSCIDCHMPPRQAKDVVHAALSDHRVPRRPGDRSRPLPGPGHSGHLQTYFADRMSEDDPTLRRDLGVALVQDLRGGPGGPKEFLQHFIGLLKEAAGRDPDDIEAWAALGTLQRMAGEEDQAIDTFQHVLKRSPNNVPALTSLGRLLDGDPRLSAAYFLRGVNAYPSDPAFQSLLAFAHVSGNRWAEAEAPARRWLELEPGEPAARFLLCRVLGSLGKLDEARAQFAILRKMKSSSQPEFDEWHRRTFGK